MRDFWEDYLHEVLPNQIETYLVNTWSTRSAPRSGVLWNNAMFLTARLALWLVAIRGDESICYRGSLCKLPLSKRAAQLFSHTMKPVKMKKIVHQQKQTTNESQRKFKTAGLAWMLRGPHEYLLRAAYSSPLGYAKPGRRDSILKCTASHCQRSTQTLLISHLLQFRSENKKSLAGKPLLVTK